MAMSMWPTTQTKLCTDDELKIFQGSFVSAFFTKCKEGKADVHGGSSDSINYSELVHYRLINKSGYPLSLMMMICYHRL